MLLQSTAFRISAVVGFLGVALGAFGAHGLEGLLQRNQTAEIWETAVLYHLIHAVVLLVLSSIAGWRRGAWISFAAGVLIFSGTLYLLAVTNVRWLGAITPIGGVAMLVGWLWLAVTGLGRRDATGTE